MSARVPLACLLALAIGAPAHGQLLRLRPRPTGPPPGTPPLDAEIWPFPPPDPKSWWEDKRLKTEEAADPLGGRRLRRGERLAQPDNGVDASTYRLWALMPLQWQLLRGDEAILEVWTRPSNSVRQTVTRITLRSDGKAFVQGRAGLACCEALIGRRMGFDAELPPGSAERFRRLLDHPLWSSPRDVAVAERGAAEGVCVDGSAYDITLLTPSRAKSVHRACDPAAIGEAADVLEAVLGAALGHDPRFDVVFRGGANFDVARAAYQDLIAGGGRLKPARVRSTPPGGEPAPQPEPDATPPAPEPPVPPRTDAAPRGGR